MMFSSITQHLVTDDLTILLGLIAATIILLRSLHKPPPLVHPVLLGRQSDVARVRRPGESAIYRNYGTGMMGRFPVRPSKEIHLLSDLVHSDIPKTLWTSKINNAQILQRASAFASGLSNAVRLVPNESSVLLLLNDSVEFLIADLALATLLVRSATLSSADLLPLVLKNHPPTAVITDVQFLSRFLDQLVVSGGNWPQAVVVVSDRNVTQSSSLVNILTWSHVEKQGEANKSVPASTPNVGDVFTVAYHGTADGQLRGVELTHQNLTAGVAAIRTLVPFTNVISSLDTIASAHSLSTPFGRAVAYTALYEGTSFATLNSAKLYRSGEKHEANLSDIISVKKLPIPTPTILLVKPSHLEDVTNSIHHHAKKNSILNMFAWRHKLAGLREGFVSKESLWDRLVFDAAREETLGDIAGTLRAVIVSDGTVSSSLLVPARVALSIPLVNTYTHEAVAGPVLASHPLDLQMFPAEEGDPFRDVAHVGPASINIEAKVIGVDDQTLLEGGNPRGDLYIRGPPVGRLGDTDEEGWIKTGTTAQVYSNGVFKVL